MGHLHSNSDEAAQVPVGTAQFYRWGNYTWNKHWDFRRVKLFLSSGLEFISTVRLQILHSLHSTSLRLKEGRGCDEAQWMSICTACAKFSGLAVLQHTHAHTHTTEKGGGDNGSRLRSGPTLKCTYTQNVVHSPQRHPHPVEILYILAISQEILFKEMSLKIRNDQRPLSLLRERIFFLNLSFHSPC